MQGLLLLQDMKKKKRQEKKSSKTTMTANILKQEEHLFINIMTQTHNLQIFGQFPFVKPQSNT